MKEIIIICSLLLIVGIVNPEQGLLCNNSNDSLLMGIEKFDKREQFIKLNKIIKEKIIALDMSNLKYIDKAADIARELGDDNKLNLIKLYYGEYWKIFGDYNKSAKTILSALSYYELNDNYFFMQRSYRILAETYRASTMHHKAIDYLFKAEKICKEINDSLELAFVYNRLSAVYYEYYESTEIKKSKYYAERCMELIDSTDDYHLYNNNLILLGAIEMFFRNYKMADYYLLKAFRLSKKYKDYYNFHSVLINLAMLNYKKNELNNSLKYAHICENFSKERNIEALNLYLYQLMGNVYEKKGQLDSALHYAQLTAGLTLDIFNAKKDFILSDLSQNNENEKKLIEFEEQKIRQYYVLIIFFITTILFVGIIFQYYTRQKMLKQKNLTISEQNTQLSDLNATKDKFFSIIAHDLRNPISSFKNITDVMDSDFDVMSEEDKKDFIGLLKKSAVHISELLENLLTWSRSQRGKIDYIALPVEISIIIDSNLNLLELPAAKKRITLSSDYPKDFTVLVDINMINTVIRNLISNAIKFTPENGRIIVKAREVGDSILISVIDNGMGIEPENLEKLFRIDENLTTLGTNNEKGTGLGLIICKEFVERNGGKIWVESEVNKGSSFNFTIPVYKEVETCNN